MSNNDSHFEVHPAGAVVFVAFVVLTAAYILTPRTWIDELLDGTPSEPVVPETLSAATLQQQRQELSADYAFELPSSNGIRMFIYEVSDTNYSAYAFRLDGTRYEQMSPSVHPSGFEAPFVQENPAKLLMRNRRLGLLFEFTANADELVFAPLSED